MTRCMERWRLLTTSQGEQEEETRARAFADCARANRVTYGVALKHLTSGADIPVAQLAKHVGPLEVHLSVELDGKQQALVWKASGSQGVYPLLME